MPRHPAIVKAIRELRQERNRIDAALLQLDRTGRHSKRPRKKKKA